MTPWDDVEPLAEREGSPYEVRWLRRARRVVSLGRGGIAWWDAKGRRCLRRRLPADLAHLERGRSALAADGTLVQASAGQLLAMAPEAPGMEVRAVGVAEAERLAVAPRGDLAAVLSGSGFMCGDLDVWDLERGARLWGAEEVDSVEFSPDGRRLLWQFDVPQQSGSDFLRYGACDARTGESLGSWDSVYWMQTVAFGPRGRRVLFGNPDEAPQRIHALWGEARALRGERVGAYPVPDPPPAVGSWAALDRQLQAAAR